jgi:PAS domain S-box-containing protein
MSDFPAAPQPPAAQVEEWSRLALDAASLGTWRDEIATGLVSLDARSQALWGFDRTEVGRAELIGRIHPEDRDRVLAEGAAAALDVSRHGAFAVEFRVLRPDGELRWVAVKGRLYFDRDATGRQPVLSIGAYLDVTAQKRAEEGLRAGEARFRAFVDLAADAFFLMEPGGRILDVNRQACDGLGYTRDELIGKAVQDIDAEAGASAVVDIAARMDAGETVTFDSRHRRKDGSTFPVELRARRITLNGRRYGLALVRDITDRKRGEEAVKRSEQTLRHVLDALPVGVLVVDVGGNVVLANPATERIWGGLIRDGAARYARSKAWQQDTGRALRPGDWASVHALTSGEVTLSELLDIEAFDGARRPSRTRPYPSATRTGRSRAPSW